MGAGASKTEVKSEELKTVPLKKVVVPGNTNTGATAPVTDPYDDNTMAGGGSRKKSKARFSAKRKKTRRNHKANRKSQRKNRRFGY